MEQHLNRVELKGIVGATRKIDTANTKMYRISLATNLAYKAEGGCAVIETTWNEVTIPESAIKDNAIIEKGESLHIVGRIRNVRFTCADGESRYVTEILANECRSIKSKLEYEPK